MLAPVVAAVNGSARAANPAPLFELVAYLDEYLSTADVQDGPGALNGLQVENSGSVGRIVAAVDACQATIDAAVISHADLLLVHHGLFWGEPQRVAGRQWRRLKQLITNDIAVYSSHLPLDRHPEVGNNAVFAEALGLSRTEPFGEYDGTVVGVAGELAMPLDALVRRIKDLLGVVPQVIAGGPARVRRVGIVTGGAGSMIGQARAARIDTFVTGEGGHHTYFDAEEGGVNVIYGGHYATETFGVKALATHIEERFGIPWEFADHPTGL